MRHLARDAIRVSDHGVVREDFLADVIEGLRQPQKEIFSKYFYDERGSELFDRITELDEYYPTRTEMQIMAQHGGEIVDAIGPRVMLVEYGSGSGAKTRFLLERLDRPVAYVPIDISRDFLLRSARSIALDHPNLEVLPVVADYTATLELPKPHLSPDRVVVYFPGSTVGNFDIEQGREFLKHAAEVAGPDGALLIGVDLVKDISTLERAYNDASGVTAEFNLNLLRRINRELGADFDLEAFEHRANWNPAFSRIEMHLVSRRRQSVHVDGETFNFDAGETIHTENCHKFSTGGFAELAGPWFRQDHVWTDENRLFSLQYLTTRPIAGDRGSVLRRLTALKVEARAEVD